MYYKLADRTPVPCGLLEWTKELEKPARIIAVYRSPDVAGRVSTVFLGLDHSLGGGPPLLFETMIFGGPHDQYQTRCSTYDEAETMHALAVKIFNGEVECDK